MLGETISHYRIIEKLGEGGMGVVYRAVDTRLDREVAIKFLPAHLSSDPVATKRFIHEAKAASAIDHSNIGTIYEIDETDDGVTFIVMALYDGETLRERMDRGQIGVGEALDIASQIASGLSKAHRKNIVHRDIKPSNIIITSDGEVKIIDFGLAKLAGRTRLTKEASTLGTAAYMSPEQAKGEEVDHRSDIFSLGVILYEMLAGEPPFKGEHEAALLYEIVHEEPEPLTRHKDNLPRGTQLIVERALRKNAGDRYTDINEMISDIDRIHVRKHSIDNLVCGRKGTKRRRLIVAGAGLIAVIAILGMSIHHFIFTKKELIPERITIAVLPFSNLGPPDDEYFCDGITDAITSRLVSISALGVIARQSVIQYKNSDKNIPTIAEELGGVEYVLEGTVQRERPSDLKSAIRIIPQLIRVADGIHIWAATYDEDMEQVFAIQSNIADCVAEELNVAILGRERQALHMKPTENLLAYDYYLRGREYEERGIDRNATEISIELYHKAAQEDPGFAQAYARICLQHCRMYWHAWDQTEGRRTNAKEAIDKAISLEPDDPLVRAANGYYYYYCMRDYARALKEFSRARQSEPGNSFYLSSISFVQGRLGKFDDSLNNMLAAFKYDPRSAMIAYGLSGAYNNLRRYEEAEKQCDRAISLAPDVGVYYVYKAGILINKTGNTTKAREVVREYMTRFGIESCWDLVYFDVFDGKYQNAMEGLELIDEEVDTRQGLYKPKDSIRGDIYALTGQTELSIHHYNKALAMLEKDINDRPDDVRIHAELGQVYAHLGQRDKALIEAQKIIELEPVTRDAGRGGWYLTFVAAIHTILGDYDEALDILERLPNNSSFPFCGYIGALKVNPVWAPLSDEPRFMRLMDSIAGTKT